MFFYGESESSNRFVHLQVVDYRANGKPTPPATRRYKKKSSECGSPFSPREIVKEEKSDKASESPRGTKDEDLGERGCQYDSKEQQQQQQQQLIVNEEMGNKPSSLASKIRKGSSKTKSVKGKKKKEKDACEKQDVEKTTTPTTTASTNSETQTATTTTTAITTTTTNPQLDDYVDVKHEKVTSSDEEDRSLSPDGDDDDDDSGCGESADACTSDERYEDHACQTDTTEDSKSTTTASKEDVISSGVAVPQCHPIEKSFEDLGVQTEPSFNNDNQDAEAFDKPLLSSSMDEETLVQALRRRSETTDTADLHLIDAILEKNKQTIETMKTNYIKEYLNSTATSTTADIEEELQINNTDTHKGTEKESTEDDEKKMNVSIGVVEEEDIQAEEEVSLESADWDVDNMSEGTSSYDEEQAAVNSSESDCDEVEGLPVISGKLMAETQRSVESDSSGVEIQDFKPKILLAQEEEEGDSGTELRYDEVANKDGTTTPPTATTSDYDYNKYVDKIKPLLYDAELVANLYIRLSNKYSTNSVCINEKETREDKTQHIHSAQIAYDVIKENNLTNFSHVVTHLLSYLGAIKSEKPIPENASIPNLLSFLEEMVKQNTMTAEHVTMLTCFLARPNRALLPHSDLRTSFLLTCFKQELSQLNVHTDERTYLRTCFIKLCEYFVQLDMTLTQQLTRDYLLPHLSDTNSTTFIMDALTYMGLVKSETMVITTQDITSPLILLDFIFVSKRMSLLTSQKLYAFIQLNNPRFKFCSTEREAVANTLRKAIDF